MQRAHQHLRRAAGGAPVQACKMRPSSAIHGEVRGGLGAARPRAVFRQAAGRRPASSMGGMPPCVPLAELPAVTNNPEARAVLGIVQIPTDYVLEKEGASIVELFPGVEMSLQKMVFGDDSITADTYRRAADNITAAAATFLPAERCSVLGVACTSLSYTLGPAHIDNQLRAANPGAATTDMARAQMAALQALQVERVALVTPYIQELADANAAFLESGEQAGARAIHVVSRATMYLERDELTSQVDKQTLQAWVQAVDRDDVEAVVIGCSAFRAAERGFLDELEALIGKPVVTSTQAFMWSMLRTAGVEDQVSGYGALFSRC